MGMITLVNSDKLQIKSKIGVEGDWLAREHSFCGRTILTPDEIFTVPDACLDEMFANNPLVTGAPNVRFYSGVPLVNSDGYPLGVLCVADHRPRIISEEQKETLRALAKQVMLYFELHKRNSELEVRQKNLDRVNRELEQFAYILAHDIKSPCSNIVALSYLIGEQMEKDLSPEAAQMLDLLTDTSKQIAGMVDGILDHARSVNMSDSKKERFYFVDMIQDVSKLLAHTEDCYISVTNPNTELFACRNDITRILLNLCTNAIKYNNKSNKEISISVTSRAADYLIDVTDNGAGIEPEYFNRIFDLFGTIAPIGADSKGYGIGLYTVKRLVERLGGTIKVTSEVNKGSTFSFTVVK